MVKLLKFSIIKPTKYGKTNKYDVKTIWKEMRGLKNS